MYVLDIYQNAPIHTILPLFFDITFIYFETFDMGLNYQKEEVFRDSRAEESRRESILEENKRQKDASMGEDIVWFWLVCIHQKLLPLSSSQSRKHFIGSTSFA